MKMHCGSALIVCIFILIYNITLINSDITINGVSCGQITCKKGDYCSHVDSTCKACSGICNPTTRNYEKDICEKYCQDYLHDQRFMIKGLNGDEDLRATVERLSCMVTVSLTLVVILLIILLTVACIQLYKCKQKKKLNMDTIKNIFFTKKDDSNEKPPNQDHTNGKPDLRIEMPPQSAVHTDHSPVTMTTSISRRPAEDSTLDYAYDNPAMVSSPSPTKTNDNNFR